MFDGIFNGNDSIGLFYFLFGMAGTLLFVVRTVLQFSGVIDDDGGYDVHDASYDAHDGDSTTSFRYLSLSVLTSFFMMFGWVGYAFHKELNSPFFVSLLFATVAGVISVWIIRKLLTSARKLASSGTVHMSNYIGATGIVYLTIYPDRGGIANIMYQGRVRELKAQPNGKEVIETGKHVKVIDVIGDLCIVEEETRK